MRCKPTAAWSNNALQAGFGENLRNITLREAACRKASAPAMLIFPLDLPEAKKRHFYERPALPVADESQRFSTKQRVAKGPSARLLF